MGHECLSKGTKGSHVVWHEWSTSPLESHVIIDLSSILIALLIYLGFFLEGKFGFLTFTNNISWAQLQLIFIRFLYHFWEFWISTFKTIVLVILVLESLVRKYNSFLDLGSYIELWLLLVMVCLWLELICYWCVTNYHMIIQKSTST